MTVSERKGENILFLEHTIHWHIEYMKTLKGVTTSHRVQNLKNIPSISLCRIQIYAIEGVTSTLLKYKFGCVFYYSTFYVSNHILGF